MCSENEHHKVLPKSCTSYKKCVETIKSSARTIKSFIPDYRRTNCVAQRVFVQTKTTSILNQLIFRAVVLQPKVRFKDWTNEKEWNEISGMPLGDCFKNCERPNQYTIYLLLSPQDFRLDKLEFLIDCFAGNLLRAR